MKVELYDTDDDLSPLPSPIATAIYLFNDLLPGTYYVRFPTPPAGYLWTTQNVGAADADSDVNVTTYRTAAITLDAGQNDPTWDAGLVAVANIGDFVWADNNFNGFQDGGEPGVPDMSVSLLNSSGTPGNSTTAARSSRTTVTDAERFLSFHSICVRGSMKSRFTRPAGYIFTTQNVNTGGSTDANDSDADCSGATSGAQP